MTDKPPPERKLDPRTCRPLDAHRIKTREPEPYTREFSRALGLKPSPTRFGRRKVDV